MATDYGQLFDPERSNQKVLKILNKCTKTKARSSVPDILTIKKVNDCFSVFAKCSFSQATQFGPLEAPLVTKNEVDETKFLIKLNIEKCRRLENVDASYIYYDITDENMCNWMMFVQPAKSFSEQNLCAHQEEDFIFYTTVRDVLPDEELKVWYSPSYAEFLCVSVLTPNSGMVSVPKFNNAAKARKPKTSIRMQVYLNSMITERDVRSVPPKKRGWRRTRDKRADGTNGATGFLSFTNPESKRIVRKTFVKIPKTYDCPICRKKFKSRDKLGIHSVVHSNVRNFLCHYCGLTFKRKDKLQDHVANVHNRGDTSRTKKVARTPNLELYPFRCTQCIIGFQRRGMFINHLIKRHPDVQTSSLSELSDPIVKTIRDFLCPYCEKVYKSSTKRKLHISKQHPGKPLPPSIKQSKRVTSTIDADKTVIEKESITVAPVCCPYCTRQYSTKNKMNKHVKDKHKEEFPLPSVNATTSSCQTMPIYNEVNVGISPNHEQNDVSQVYTAGLGDNNQIQNDLLTQACAISALDSSRPEPNYSNGYNSPNTKGSFSRYAGGRKHMLLKQYDNSQNVATQAGAKIPYDPGKQMPYKNRVLNSEPAWRHTTLLSDQVQCNSISLPDFSHSNQVQHLSYSVISSNGDPQNPMLDPCPSNDTLVLNTAQSIEMQALHEQNRPQHSILQTVYPGTPQIESPTLEAHDLYQNNVVGNWMYQQGCDVIAPSTYIAR